MCGLRLFRLFLCLLGFFRLGIFLLDLCFIFACINLVGGKQFLVCNRVLEHCFEHIKDILHTIGSHTIETEAVGLLALTEEVREEIIQHITVPVELQKIRLVVGCCTRHFRSAVLVQSGDDSDFTCLLVLDDEDILVFLFLFHN